MLPFIEIVEFFFIDLHFEGEPPIFIEFLLLPKTVGKFMSIKRGLHWGASMRESQSRITDTTM